MKTFAQARAPRTPQTYCQTRIVGALGMLFLSAAFCATNVLAAPASQSEATTNGAQAGSQVNPPPPPSRSTGAAAGAKTGANAGPAALAPSTAPATSNNATALTPDTSTTPASTIYRQVLPNGSTVYSDQPLKGAKVKRELSVAPLIKGNGWTTENLSGSNPAQSQSTPIKRRSNNSEAGAQRTREDAQADVMRAEMLLEDAKLRQSSGAEPLPGERTGTAGGKSRLNQSYHVRQESLERDVAQAQSNLQQAIAERNNMR